MKLKEEDVPGAFLPREKPVDCYCNVTFSRLLTLSVLSRLFVYRLRLNNPINARAGTFGPAVILFPK